MMKHFALSSAVLRALINGRNCNRHGPAVAAVRPFVAVEMRHGFVAGSGNGGFFYWKRMMASEAVPSPPPAEEAEAKEKENSGTGDGKSDHSVVVSSYWGISRPKISREDGTVWPWNCFMPWETYQSNLSIDLTKHHVPKNFMDKVAYRTVKLLRIPTDIFFKRRYGCRAMMLETVAAVPGMVGGMLLHLRSLRKFQHSGGWIKALLDEAENERMHLMTMVELVKPKWYERLLVLAVQGVFFNAFFVLYVLSPKLAHRIVGYLEEEAIHSYTEYLKDLDSGAIENVPAPAIAIDYWRLSKDAKLKDVITVIRADEAHHRDVNHFASDVHFHGKELREAPAPLGYHYSDTFSFLPLVWLFVSTFSSDPNHNPSNPHTPFQCSGYPHTNRGRLVLGVHRPHNTISLNMASSAPPAQAQAPAFPDGTVDYKPARGKQYDLKKPHITEQPITLKNWYNHVNWLNVTFIIFVPLLGLISTYWVPLQFKTAVWSVIYYFNTGLGITAGYHRLWAHRSYKASLPLRIYLAAVGAGAVEGSIRWWSRDHRAHHRYTDTVKDPYSVRKGLMYSHIGWMVMKQNPKRIGRTDITDLNEDPVVVWQHLNFIKSVIFMGIVFPTLVAGLGWGDWWGGYVYAGILRIFFVQQATFCVNSLAHWLGEQPFDDRNSPRDHVVTALVTLGEGYHNFHHEFPSDYRNAISWWQYDPTKWSIWVWKQLGLASDLKTFRQNEIEKGRLQQQQKKLDQKRAKLDWGVPLEQLPVIDWDDYVEQAKNGRGLVAIAGVIHDVTDFIKDHPGGKALISSGIGKDATAIFNGGVYLHSNAAHNLLSTMRVGVLRGGCEVEIWKRAQMENKDVSFVNDSSGNRIIRAGNQPTKVAMPVVSADAA